MKAVSLQNRQQGASKLELAVASIILAVLASWLLHTFRFYQELAEKTAVETVAMNFRTGLRFKIAELIIKGEADKQRMLVRQNPVQFLEEIPKGYMGELRSPGNLPRGSWYFDQAKSDLIYIPHLESNLRLLGQAAEGGLALRWQIKMVGKEEGLQLVDVELLTPYRWF